jgi:hypothetical protein
MNLTHLRFPRQLEGDQSVDTIRRVLSAGMVKLWSDGTLDVPHVRPNKALKQALNDAGLRGQMRTGFEGISEKLDSEKAGIDNVRKQETICHGDRVSRLLLLSNDGAERLYRHVERLLYMHTPRLLGCLLDIDSKTLSIWILQEERNIKVVMAEHKDAVSTILRAIARSEGSEDHALQ